MIKENYSITDKFRFGISACDITGSFPSPLTIGNGEGRSFPSIGSVYERELNITIKHILLLLEHTIECPNTDKSKNLNFTVPSL